MGSRPDVPRVRVIEVADRALVDRVDRRRCRHCIAGPVGAHGAGFGQGDLDSESVDLLGQYLAEALDRMFGGLVGAESWCGEPATGRGDLDEMAEALFAPASFDDFALQRDDSLPRRPNYF